MFYKPELLSFKNKTEISLIYYCSTCKGRKKVKQVDISNFDIVKSVNNIMNPPEVFALRLNLYLMKGIVVIWNMKKDYLKKTIQKFDLRMKSNIKREPKIHPKQRKLTFDNTKVDQIFPRHNRNLNTISLFDDVSEINENQKDNFIELYKDNLNDNKKINIGGNELEIKNDLNEGSNQEFNNTVEFLGDVEVGEDLLEPINDESVLSRIKRIKIDKTTTINIKPFNDNSILEDINIYPSLLSGDIFTFLDKEVKQEIRNIQQRRNSSTSSSIPVPTEFGRNATISSEPEYLFDNFPDDLNYLHDNDNQPRGVNHSKAMWFYNLLVDASKGKIVPIQNHPYDEIRIQ
ncbi:hypothetical protein HERIO_476 [Hepatospora eriocheir]|uniref:Rad21/Rec8-like protein N-terminal domain-containing protein n=1 Tax=Hepatospora eriocheir TaxID=1081669 RepID=A0A1X0QD28_9MICR|nr:hypothetical protein HERIO_476 [Hepatospora eriocheir]